MAPAEPPASPRRGWITWLLIGLCAGLGYGATHRLLRYPFSTEGWGGHLRFGVKPVPGTSLDSLRQRSGERDPSLRADLDKLQAERDRTREQADTDRRQAELETRDRERQEQQAASEAQPPATDPAAPALPAEPALDAPIESPLLSPPEPPAGDPPAEPPMAPGTQP
jgi:hypothetical protein